MFLWPYGYLHTNISAVKAGGEAGPHSCLSLATRERPLLLALLQCAAAAAAAVAALHSNITAIVLLASVVEAIWGAGVGAICADDTSAEISFNTTHVASHRKCTVNEPVAAAAIARTAAAAALQVESEPCWWRAWMAVSWGCCCSPAST